MPDLLATLGQLLLVLLQVTLAFLEIVAEPNDDLVALGQVAFQFGHFLHLQLNCFLVFFLNEDMSTLGVLLMSLNAFSGRTAGVCLTSAIHPISGFSLVRVGALDLGLSAVINVSYGVARNVHQRRTVDDTV